VTTTDAEIRTYLATRVEAMQAKDIDRLMSFFAPEIVYYDVVPPLQFTGTDAVRRNFLRWFDGYEGPIGLATHDVTIAVAGDLAYVNLLHLDSGQRRGGLQASIWVRVTTCLRRSAGTWLATHEHVSIPFDPASLSVWLPTEKDQPA
jgi:ketosteroid isomerase-like protein